VAPFPQLMWGVSFHCLRSFFSFFVGVVSSKSDGYADGVHV